MSNRGLVYLLIISCLSACAKQTDNEPSLCNDLGGGGPLGYTSVHIENGVFYDNLIINNGNPDIIYFRQQNSVQNGFYEYHISTQTKTLISTAKIYTYIVTKHGWLYYYDQLSSQSMKVKTNGDSLTPFSLGSNVFFVDYDYNDDEIGCYTYSGGYYYGLILDNQENVLDTVPIQNSFAHEYTSDRYALVNTDGIYVYDRVDKSSFKVISNYPDQFASTGAWSWIGNDIIWTNWCGVNRTTQTGANSVLKQTTRSDRYTNIYYLSNINKLIAVRAKQWDDTNLLELLHTSSKIVLMDVDGSNEIEMLIP